MTTTATAAALRAQIAALAFDANAHDLLGCQLEFAVRAARRRAKLRKQLALLESPHADPQRDHQQPELSGAGGARPPARRRASRPRPRLTLPELERLLYAQDLTFTQGGLALALVRLQELNVIHNTLAFYVRTDPQGEIE